MKLPAFSPGLIWIATLFCLTAVPKIDAGEVLVPAGSVWKFWDQGTDLGTAWREPSFNDSAWGSGPAQLGFGDGDEATVINSATANGERIVTAYFRHTFSVSGMESVSNLLVRLLRDDGGAVYVNGVEVFRSNLPTGPILFNTLALSASEEPSVFVPGTVNPGVLREGANVIAVEIHQVNALSSDLSFDLELIADRGGTPPEQPVVTVTAPDAVAGEIDAATGAPDPGVFRFTRTGPVTDALPVSYAVSGTAANGVDYVGSDSQPLSGAIVIPAGASTVNVIIRPIDDGVAEPTETAIVTLLPPNSPAAPPYLVGTPGSAQIDILDRSVTPPGEGEVLVAAGSVWKYWDQGTDLGTAWRDAAFNDSAWPSGPAQLGFGDGDETTVISATSSSGARYVTAYFRRTFQVTDVGNISNLTVRLLRDDGGVVYINGVEVFRSNLPAGAITFDTLALVAADEMAGFVSAGISPSVLQEGANVIAVEIHQVNALSSDLSFDLELIAGGGGTPPQNPVVTVTAVDPVAREGIDPATGLPVDTGTFQFSRSGPVTESLTVFYAVSGTAANGTDYIGSDSQPWSGVIEIPAGASTVNAVLRPIDDGVVEPTETAIVTLLPPNAPAARPYLVGTPGSAQIDILDGSVAPPGEGEVLVAAGSVWNYWDQGTDLGTAWRDPAFNDSAWPSGPAQLGFGDGDEATVINATSSSGARYVTAYFRRTFQATEVGSVSNLTVRLLRDDGGVVYINGVEVFRSNLPPGPILFNTFAVAVSEEPSVFVPASVSPSVLREGANVVAVEIHQVNVTSSDLSFDLELLADGAVTPPPQPLVTVTALDGVAREGLDPATGLPLDAGVFQFARTGPVTEALPVFYAISGTAANGVDYVGSDSQPLSGRVEIPAGASTVNVLIAPLDDGVSEPTESVVATVLPPATTPEARPYLVGTPESARIDVLDRSVNPPGEGEVLVAAGSVWKYWDQGTDLGTAWREPGFSDVAWPSGPAQLGFGDGDEATVISSGSSSGLRYVTAYFRRTFQVSGAGSVSNLTVRLLRDDGGVVYINGVEVFRSNLPPGPITFDTLALLAVGGPEETSEFVTASVSPGVLREGANVIAVEIHQVNVTSSDLSFDLELIAQGGTPPPCTSPDDEQCDGDGDGVPNGRDACPDTPAGALVNANGCSLAQLCPCGGPWNNHAEYVRCVIDHAWEFFRANLLTADQRREIIRDAVRSDCGSGEAAQEAAQLHLLPLTPAECRTEGMRFVVSDSALSECRVETSTDLIHWSWVQTIPTDAIGDEMVCPTDANEPKRFFRVRRVSP